MVQVLALDAKKLALCQAFQPYALPMGHESWNHEKPNLLATTLPKKYKLADAELNEYTVLKGSLLRDQRSISPFSEEEAASVPG